MTSYKFLPTPRPNEGYPINGSGAVFSENDISLFKDIATYMDAPSPKTSPRRPTPFSVVWQFAHDLQRPSGDKLQRTARRRFRALIGLLALRKHHGLALELRVSPLFGEAEERYPIVNMFRRHNSCRPGELFRGKQLVYLTLGDRVVAGFSPLTLLFPAARCLELPDALRPPWYSSALGEWLDPTVEGEQIEGREEVLGRSVVMENRLRLGIWLRDISSWLNRDGNAQSLQLVENYRNLILREFDDWINELGQLDGSLQQLVEESIPVKGKPSEEASLLCSLGPFGVTVDGAAPTDLVKKGGLYLLSRTLLGDPGTRIFGAIRGEHQLAKYWDQAPVCGTHLGDALGLERGEREALPIPFLLVDKLFTAELSSVAPAGADTRRGWKVPSRGADVGVYLYPFSVNVFEYFTPEEVVMGTNIEKNGQQYHVTFRVGSFSCGKTFTRESGSPNPKHVDLDAALDLRVFPDYDLSSVLYPSLQLPLAEDNCYFSRVRLGDSLAELQIVPLLHDGTRVRLASADNEYESLKQGSLQAGAGGQFGPGLRLYQMIRSGRMKLAGFIFGDKGFILAEFQKPGHPGGAEIQPKTIGIDFGTSNTCLASVVTHGDEQAIVPKAAATCLLSKFFPAPRGQSHEGFSALFDFFFSKDGERALTNQLYDGTYFPTQLASRSAFLPGAITVTDAFRPEQALICFQSVSDLFRVEPTVMRSVHRYEETEKVRDFEPQVNLKDRLKWDSSGGKEGDLFRNLRRIFHRHLRLQVVHSIAQSGGYVDGVRASYPRAFTNAMWKNYKAELESIWHGDNTIPEIKVFTESHAAAAYLTPQPQVDHFLIDVGGGTTDICLFANSQLCLESSFRLAADVIDRQMMALCSRKLRELMVEQLRQHPILGIGAQNKELLDFLAKRFIESSVVEKDFENAVSERAVFYALLAMLRREGDNGFDLVCSSLSETNLNERSVHTFFTVVALLFGGISYFAGRMYRNRPVVTDSNHRVIQLSFAGNGSSHLGWLGTLDDGGCKRFLTAMFQAGAGLEVNDTVSIEILKEPKTAVAIGLVRNKIESISSGRGEVYNGVDGAWHTQSDLRSFYLRGENLVGGWAFEASELRTALVALSQACGGGAVGGMRISPDATQDWATKLCDNSSAQKLSALVGRRLQNCKNEFSNDLNNSIAGLALEPIMVAEICALLQVLREGN